MSTYKAYLVFNAADEKTVTFSYPSKSAISSANMITVMDAFITNGSIFKTEPVSKKAAYIVATDQTNIDISGS